MDFLKIIKRSTISIHGQVCPNWRKLEADGMSQTDIDDAISEGIAMGVFERRFDGAWAGENLYIVRDNGLTNSRGRLL